MLQQLKKLYKNLLPIERVTLLYGLLTTVLLFVWWGDLNHPMQQLQERGAILLVMAMLYVGYWRKPVASVRFLRNLFPLALISYWYPDIYEFCSLLPNLDPVFANADQVLFGCQPSLEFSRTFSSGLWSELFHMGYFAYYPMIFLTVLLTLVLDKARFEEYGFIVLTAFLLYYAIYLFVPVAGPQYYFQAIGQEAAEAGNFYDIGNYFRTHLEMRPSPGPDGFFRSCVEAAQAGGERPQAAFPSSHVGVSTVLMILLFRLRKWLCAAVFPFYFFLCCATVYIEAHYLVDVIGGLISAVIFYWFAKKLFDSSLKTL